MTPNLDRPQPARCALPWWSLAAISALTLLVATVTGCSKSASVVTQAPTHPGVIATAPPPALPAVQAPFDAVEAPPTF